MKRLENYRKERHKKVHTHQRIFSRVLAKKYLTNLRPNTLGYVEGQGFFRNVIDKQLVEQFLPGLYTNSLEEAVEISKWKKEAECIFVDLFRTAGSSTVSSIEGAQMGEGSGKDAAGEDPGQEGRNGAGKDGEEADERRRKVHVEVPRGGKSIICEAGRNPQERRRGRRKRECGLIQLQWIFYTPFIKIKSSKIIIYLEFRSVGSLAKPLEFSQFLDSVLATH